MLSKPFVLILGMHRSGTSCLAGCLNKAGLFLGDVSRRGRFNAKGNHESKEIWRLHDQILGINRGSWHQPPPRVEVHSHHRQLLQDAIQALEHRRPAGVKDPRLLLLLDTWRELVAPPYSLVGSFRHPLAVARSLADRDGIPQQQAIDLWLAYNGRLMRQHEASPFPIIQYDLSDVGGYCRRVAAVARDLSLAPKIGKLQRFVAAELEHQATSDELIPESCREVYGYLQRHQQSPECCEVSSAWPAPMSWFGFRRPDPASPR